MGICLGRRALTDVYVDGCGGFVGCGVADEQTFHFVVEDEAAVLALVGDRLGDLVVDFDNSVGA